MTVDLMGAALEVAEAALAAGELPIGAVPDSGFRRWASFTASDGT